MSEPKRYERCYHKDYIPEGMEEHYNGKWVSYADYARLKAEVERLRKAGDLLCFHYISLARNRWPDDPLPSSVTDWQAAKEGKQS